MCFFYFLLRLTGIRGGRKLSRTRGREMFQSSCRVCQLFGFGSVCSMFVFSSESHDFVVLLQSDTVLAIGIFFLLFSLKLS